MTTKTHKPGEFKTEKDKLAWFTAREVPENVKRMQEVTKKGGNIMNHDSSGTFSKISGK